MKRKSEHNLEQQEIRLDSSAGLDMFRKHFEEQYAEFLSATKEVDEDVTLLPEIKRGKDAYFSLLGCTAQAASSVQRGQVDTDLLGLMQDTYNNFLSVYVTITTAAELERERKAAAKRRRLDDTLASRGLRDGSLLTKKITENTEIVDTITTYYTSLSGFEAALWRFVRHMEDPSKLDKVLKVNHGSVFSAVLRGASVAELDQFLLLRGEQVRAALLEMQYEDKVQYDYRTYVAWMDLYREMKEMIEPADSLLFEELLALYQLVIKEANASL
ncbi:hypothetical protein CL638_00845 [bacterium]|nr:hypothetical protein [bacterium]|tara:strand:- start:170 stop:985 length:816 start_codon:yes stop_codon:yes gene_type:complete